MLLILLIIVVFVLANIAWSTVRLGISPTPSNKAMRRACTRMVQQVSSSNCTNGGDGGDGYCNRTHQNTLNDAQNAETNSIVVAGSGWGGLAYTLSQHHKGPIICYEAALVPWLCSKTMNMLRKRFSTSASRIQFIKQNTANITLTPQSIVVCYLYPAGTQRLFRRLQQCKVRPLGLISVAFAVNCVQAAATITADDWMKTHIYWYPLDAPLVNRTLDS